MAKEKTIRFILVCGAVLTVAGAVMQIAGLACAPYVFTTGAALIIYLHLRSVWEASYVDTARMRRLLRIGFIASTMLVISSCLMFLGSNSWVAFLLIYAVVTLYLSFRAE